MRCSIASPTNTPPSPNHLAWWLPPVHRCIACDCASDGRVKARGHPDAAPGSSESARWGQRWTYDLVPDGPDVTDVTESYDCSRAPESERIGMDNGRIWVEAMTATLQRLDDACTRAPEDDDQGQLTTP